MGKKKEIKVHDIVLGSYFRFKYLARANKLGDILRFEKDIGEAN